MEKFKIIRTLKGKKITPEFYRENRHLFAEPYPLVLESAVELMKKNKNGEIYIDELGKVSFLDPES